MTSTMNSEHISGTKVNLGNDAPTRREGAGTVAAESLAAESHDDGGEFTKNRNAAPEKYKPASEIHDANVPRTSEVDDAPTYVNNVINPSHGKPHGKNITEDEHIHTGKTRDGLKTALRSEPGSMDDPSRNVEYLLSKETAAAVDAEGTNNKFYGLDSKTEA